MDTSQFHFPHYKLDAWRVAHELADRVREVVQRIPRGYRSIGNQLLRSAVETEALIAEGASRYSSGQKRVRFTEARGECGETACHLERLWQYRLISETEVTEMLGLANRVGAMLTGLIKRHS